MQKLLRLQRNFLVGSATLTGSGLLGACNTPSPLATLARDTRTATDNIRAAESVMLCGSAKGPCCQGIA